MKLVTYQFGYAYRVKETRKARPFAGLAKVANGAAALRRQGAAETLRALWTRFETRRRAQRTINALSNLADHELKDIGLDRTQIRSAAWERTAGARHRQEGTHIRSLKPGRRTA